MGHPNPFAPIIKDSNKLAFVIATPEVIDEHLLYWFVVGDQDVTNGASADEVADFFGEILGMVAGTLKRLRHKNDLQACLAMNVFGILDVAEEDEIAEAIHLGVGAKDIDGLSHVATGESIGAIGKHLLEQRSHLSEVAGVFRVDATSGGLSAAAEAE